MRNLLCLFIGILLSGCYFPPYPESSIEFNERCSLENFGSGGYFLTDYKFNNPQIDSIGYDVISYANDKNFILALQISSFREKFSTAYDSTNMQLNFWIISFPDSMIYGPLDYKGYCIKRKALKVPEDLKLELTI